MEAITQMACFDFTSTHHVACVEFKISYYTGPSRVLAKRMKKTERVWQHLNSDNMALLHHGIHENDKKVTLNMRTDL
jgi:hypothetical protein